MTTFTYVFPNNVMDDYNILPPFQIVGRFGKSRYIDFAMHLYKTLSRFMTKIMHLDLPKRPTIWNEGVLVRFGLEN